MGNHKAGAGELLQEPGQFPLNLPSQVGVQCRKGLIQQQHLGLGGQNPGQGHPLLLSPRELTGALVAVLLQLEAVQQLLHRHSVPGSHSDVLLHGVVGKEGVLLEEIPHLPLLGRQVHPLFVVKQHSTVQFDVSCVRGEQSGNTPQSHRLTAA